MSNMSYCRFENTLHDLSDCKYALEDLTQGEGKLSSEEEEAAHLLVLKCLGILELLAGFHAIPLVELIQRSEEDLKSLVRSLNANAESQD